MLLTAWEIVMPFQLIRWLRQCRVKTDRIVWVNVAKINASWRYERGFYIARGGRTRVAIGTRYAKVGDWVATGEKMWMPHIALDDHRRATFSDGRHRFAWMRDHGVRALPVTCDQQQSHQIGRLFGSKSRKCRLPLPIEPRRRSK